MALTPDTPDEAFLREVDENLRREQMETFAKRYGTWLIAAVVLFLAAVGGYLYWQNQKHKQAAAQSEELMAAYNDIGAGKTDSAKKRLSGLENSGSETVRALALLTEAAIALDANDRKTALSRYQTLADDSDMPEAYRNLGLIRATSLEFDDLPPEKIIAQLQPLAKPGEPWFGTAGELTAMAYLKQGHKDQAAKLFAAIAGDKNAPATLRSRAAQIAGTLGVDVSKVLPPSQQE